MKILYWTIPRKCTTSSPTIEIPNCHDFGKWIWVGDWWMSQMKFWWDFADSDYILYDWGYHICQLKNYHDTPTKSNPHWHIGLPHIHLALLLCYYLKSHLNSKKLETSIIFEVYISDIICRSLPPCLPKPEVYDRSSHHGPVWPPEPPLSESRQKISRIFFFQKNVAKFSSNF